MAAMPELIEDLLSLFCVDIHSGVCDPYNYYLPEPFFSLEVQTIDIIYVQTCCHIT